MLYTLERNMPRKRSIHAVPITIKVAQSILDDAEFAAQNSPDAGFTSVTRTDVLRMAMRQGLDGILARQRQEEPAKTTKTAKR
jgi:hypothetical protein